MIIAEFVMQLHDDGSVTAVGYQGNTVNGPSNPFVDDDPWAGTNASPNPPPQQGGQWNGAPAGQWNQPQGQYTQQASQAQTPNCMHGPLKAVPGGVSGPNSRNPGRAYNPFWACQAPQGQAKCKLDQKSLPAVPA